MKIEKSIVAPYFTLFFLLLFYACKSSHKEVGTKVYSADFAIENVSLIPMDREGVIPNQTVLIENGKIKEIGKVSIPKGTQIIDGTGKFLIPGLTEMHAHIPIPNEGDTTIVKNTLFLYLSQGITNIRGMLGNPYHLKLREQVAKGTILGPRIYTSSPSLNGNSIKTPEEAREKVTKYQKEGYDFLKIHPGIKLSVWEKVEKTAKEVGIPYAGHVPIEVGINRALEAKYKTVDHLDGYLEGIVPTSAKVDPNANGFFGYNFTDVVDERMIADLVAKTKANEVSIVTTQTLFTRWFSPEAPEKLANEPEMKYMPAKTLFAWRQNKTQMIGNETYQPEKWERFINIRKNILKKMEEAGVNFLLGSDAPQVFNVPGFSIHHEMKAMKAVGLSNAKILASGTTAPAQFFKAKGEYGTIQKGAAADLVLVDGNPLEDLGNAQKIVGVMVGKTWLPKTDITAKLAEIAKGYAEED